MQHIGAIGGLDRLDIMCRGKGRPPCIKLSVILCVALYFGKNPCQGLDQVLNWQLQYLRILTFNCNGMSLGGKATASRY